MLWRVSGEGALASFVFCPEKATKGISWIMCSLQESVSNRLAKASFLSALLVVALHVGIGPQWVGKTIAITGIAVPFFFVAAGYLFAGRMGEPGWYLRQLKSRARSLLVPYVFWHGGSIGFAFVLRKSIPQLNGIVFGGR